MHGNTSPEPTLVERVKYLTAEQLADDRHYAAFERLRLELTHYPLAPYLEARRFGEDPAYTTAAERDRLRQRLAGTPLLGRIERRWLRHLARARHWPVYLRDFRQQRATDLRCHEVSALFGTGRQTEALAKIEPLWLTERFQHRACDAPFATWQRLGQAPELVHQRLDLAMKGGSAALVAHLAKRLGGAMRTSADAWLDVHRAPARAKHHAGRTLEGKPRIMAHAIRRSVYRDPEAAAALWHELAGSQAVPDGSAARRLAEVMFRRQRHPEAAYWLARVPAHHATERTREIAIFNAIALGRWQHAESLIENLETGARESEQWRYWQARVDAHLGRDSSARQAWESLAGERSYYGFLAADQLARPYAFGRRTIGSEGHDTLAGTPAYARVREFAALGRRYRARAEWRSLAATHPLGPAAVAAFAHAEGWPSAAIFALGRAKIYDLLELRFPLVHRAVVESQAKRHRLEPFWVMAMIRQESAFMADVRSSAGAIGLMQLMPATGRAVARRVGERGYHRGRLVEPALNIRLGTRYLRELLDQLDHPLLAVAGYNAGPHRIRRWRPKQEAMDASLWVETIPFRETRDYVKRVAYYRIIYAHRFGTDQGVKMADFFTPVSPGS